MENKDALGTRMQEQYEFRSRYHLPRRTYTIIRIDGKAFHTYTKDLERPYDMQLINDMSETARFLCQNIDGAKFAYIQSDEINILLTDFTTIHTQAWFDGNLAKLTSVSASMTTAKFNQLRPGKLAYFDSRAFIIPEPVEVANYFIWRQKDATRNSISMTAQAFFSQKQCHGRSSDELQEMLWQEQGINWDHYPERFKRGSLVEKLHDPEGCHRYWCVTIPPIFTQDNWLAEHIPALPSFEVEDKEPVEC